MAANTTEARVQPDHWTAWIADGAPVAMQIAADDLARYLGAMGRIVERGDGAPPVAGGSTPQTPGTASSASLRALRSASSILLEIATSALGALAAR